MSRKSNNLPTAIEYKMPKEMWNEPITWLGEKNADIITYLSKRGFTRMEEIVDRQDEIPVNYFTRIKGKLIFGIDL